MNFVTSHFGKMNLWPVEHFCYIFVLTFGWVCWVQWQSHPKVRTNMLKKCSIGKRFIFPKWIVTKSILWLNSCCLMKFLNSWFFFQSPIKKVYNIKQILNTNLRSIDIDFICACWKKNSWLLRPSESAGVLKKRPNFWSFDLWVCL